MRGMDAIFAAVECVVVIIVVHLGWPLGFVVLDVETKIGGGSN